VVFCLPVTCGTYVVDEAMVEELRLAHSRRAMPLTSELLLALKFAQAAGVNAYIVDPVTADEWQPLRASLRFAAH